MVKVFSSKRKSHGIELAKCLNYFDCSLQLCVNTDTVCSEANTTHKSPNRKQRRKAEKEAKKQNKATITQADCGLYNRKPPVTFEQGEVTKVFVSPQIEKQRSFSTHGFPFAAKILQQEQDFSSFSEKILVNLQKIHLHRVYPLEIYMDLFFLRFSKYSESPKPVEFLLTENVISFESIDQLQRFRKFFWSYVTITPRFRLKIENCFCRIGSKIDGHSGLVVIMSLLSNNSIEEIIELLHDSSSEMERIHIELILSIGKIKQINIAGALFGKSCEDNLRLCVAWNWRNVSFLNWSQLILQCNQNCRNCSSLLFLVGLRKHMTSTFTITNVTFGEQRFFPAKFLALSTAMNTLESPEATFKHSVLIKILGLEVFFGQQASFSNNPDVMSRSFDELECFNITFQNVTFHVEVDSYGWGFLRINLTRSPVRVRFSNGVNIEWCSDSTKETRLVAIETYSIPQKIIDDVCTTKHEPRCFISPLLFIDQDFDVPFLKAVKVQMPFSVSESVGEHFGENFKLVVFSKHATDDYQWTAIPDSSVKKFPNYFIYRSTTFSPVVSVSSEEESSMHATDFTTNYKPIYLTVCPLEEREKINFDCRRLSEEERLQIVKVKTNGIRVVTDMNKGHLVHGEISGNLEIDLRYGYKLNEDGRLVFKYPNPVHIANDQTYIMRLVDKSLYPEATITYYLSKGCVEEEEKLCQLNVQLQPHQRGGSLVIEQTHLDFETLGKILKVCNLHWSDLLQHLSLSSTKISEIQDHNSEDVLLSLQSEF